MQIKLEFMLYGGSVGKNKRKKINNTTTTIIKKRVIRPFFSYIKKILSIFPANSTGLSSLLVNDQLMQLRMH